MSSDRDDERVHYLRGRVVELEVAALAAQRTLDRTLGELRRARREIHHLTLNRTALEARVEEVRARQEKGGEG